ncbi:cytochrome P450 CYP72A616-like [Prosopis cineraria]|uniref:cytochrome P450 CYP72A616-like n=1 Tax=Prosopis cineraria TaxID=364024 RepID=UPI00240F12A1|nr:cytochrome P450 CYP72A616-like [Prosopis cineraria]XP_054805490.1 cytochrome P450 CYP72A616-like [Prosopis cineraria]
MDDIVLFPLLIAFLGLLFYGVLRGLQSIWWKPKLLQRHLKKQGIMGTTYRPLIGDMKEYVKLITEAWSKPMTLDHKIVSRVDPFTLKNMQKYGEISMFWSGTSPRLIIKDPKLVIEVLSNKRGHFGKPPLNPNILIITRGLTTLEGYTWARRRRILNPAFHLERLKGMLPVFSSSCSSMIERWQNMTNLEGKCDIDVWPELQKFTADVISESAFGSNYEEGKHIFELLRELVILVIEAMQTLYLPGFRFIPTKKNQRRKKLDREVRSMLRDLIQRKKHSMRLGQSRNDDLLGQLLQSITENNGDDQMTEEDVVEECKQFYVAGHETTSSWLTWTMIVLAIHPDWQEKARKEALQIGQEQELDYRTIANFKIINMILHEVLRLYPPVIALYQHTYKETKIGDITLPAGVDLTLPILLLNHDPEIWGDDAGEFKPERFSEGVYRASKDQLAFFPFSWGPRTCIGQNFAMLEAKMALANILRHFSWELSPSYVHAPYTVMTLQPQHGAQITLHQL